MLHRSKTTQSFLIGATSEFNNYSVGTTDEGMDWLLRHAYHRTSTKRQSYTEEMVRSKTIHRKEMPVMDQIDDGLYVISGHYRNGILLSPIIGRDIANWLLSGIKPSRYSSFTVTRRNNHEVYH